MTQITLIPFFALAFFYHLLLPYFTQVFPVLYFAPFFTLCFSRKSLFFCIWISFFIGLFFDMCTTSTPLGFYPLVCIAVTLAIYRFRIYFSEKQYFVFVLYTGLYSFVYSLVFTLFHSFVEPKFSISFFPCLLDTTFLPVLDTFYHLALFTGPIALYQFVTARRQRAFFLSFKKRLFAKVLRLQQKVFR